VGRVFTSRYSRRDRILRSGRVSSVKRCVRPTPSTDLSPYNAIPEWTPLSIQRIVPKLIAIIIGRVLVGPELNRDEEWVGSITQFVSDVYLGGVKLKGYSHFYRPFAARFLVPEIRRVWRHQAMARRRLVPLLQSRAAAQGAPRGQKLDLLQWLLDNNQQAVYPRSLEQLAELASVSYVGSTNTVSTTLANLLLDIAARPEDLAVLREEVMSAKAKLDNQSTKEGLQLFSLKHTSKLDSFMKESQRMNPAHLSTSLPPPSLCSNRLR
jgi:cytochrome P450